MEYLGLISSLFCICKIEIYSIWVINNRIIEAWQVVYCLEAKPMILKWNWVVNSTEVIVIPICILFCHVVCTFAYFMVMVFCLQICVPHRPKEARGFQITWDYCYSETLALNCLAVFSLYILKIEWLFPLTHDFSSSSEPKERQWKHTC